MGLQDAEEEPVLVTSKRILCKNVPAGMVEQNVINFFQQRCQRALLQFQAKKGVAEAIRQIHDKTFEDIKAKLPLRVYQEPESDCSTAALSEKRGARENFPPLVVLKNIPSEMPLREVERIAKMIGETDRVTTFKLKSGTSANGSGRAAQTVNSARIQY
eukprot:g11899.t1